MKSISTSTGVGHFRVERPGRLSEFLLGLDMAPLEIDMRACLAGFYEFGCVYVDGVRAREDREIQTGQTVRLHTRPKRYLVPERPLREFLIEDNREFLVLDKPSGLPVHPTLDNFVENAKTLLEREMGCTLYTTHRLDIPTQGLLIFAKTPAMQREINKLFQAGRVKKVYRAISHLRAQPGLHIHFMDPESHVPKHVHAQATDGWWECRMQIDRVEEINGGFLHEITLLTGKTHQVRAQMAAMGAPIFGDVIYGGKTWPENPAQERIALECFQLSMTIRSLPYPFTRPRSIAVPTEIDSPSSHASCETPPGKL